VRLDLRAPNYAAVSLLSKARSAAKPFVCFFSPAVLCIVMLLCNRMGDVEQRMFSSLVLKVPERNEVMAIASFAIANIIGFI
jgi:hypothetical protein